jgi:hypothetical protein
MAAWYNKPTRPGLWMSSSTDELRTGHISKAEIEKSDYWWAALTFHRWYGPIAPDQMSWGLQTKPFFDPSDVWPGEFEEWRDVRGAEGKYEVSSLGRVRVFDGVDSDRILSLPQYAVDGHNCVYLEQWGETPCKVHVLVAEVFNDSVGGVLQHKSGDKTDNRVCNLEWVAKEEDWRNVVGELEDSYEVSSLGRVRRKGGVIMPQGISDLGYKRVVLNHHFKPPISRCVHYLVCEAFHPEHLSLRLGINHKSGDKTDNRACNLEWVAS